MAYYLAGLATMLLVGDLLGQGTVQFNNRVTTGSGAQAPVVAPVYGLDGVTPLTGTGFTASLWAARSTDPDSALVQVAATPFRATTTASLMGFWQPPALAVAVPSVPSDPAIFAKFQVRVWDNMGGTITSWDQVQASSFVNRGFSQIFVVPYQLGGGDISPPTLQGLESFQLCYAGGECPEPAPTAIMLAALGLLAWRKWIRS